MDALGRQASGASADGEIVRSRSPDAGIYPRVYAPGATEASKPGTPGRPRISRNTIAQGMPVRRPTRGEFTRVLFSFVREAMGAR